jgi:hypothetical protein
VAIVAHGPENGNGGGTKKIYYNKSKKKKHEIKFKLTPIDRKVGRSTVPPVSKRSYLQ